MRDQGPPDFVARSIIVHCSVKAAFQTWTEEISTWWPKSHSFSGDANTEIFIEAEVGGRVYERASDGKRYTWGEIIAWEPPNYLAFTWHFGTGPDLPTQVEVRFTAVEGNNTQVDLIHRGRGLIDDRWDDINDQFQSAWDHILPTFKTATNKEHNQ